MDWQFGDVFLAMLVFFCWVLWFWMLFAVFGDLFRRRDIGGGAKTGWTVFVLVVPFLGTFIYLISQGHGMTERKVAQMKAAQAETDAYIRATAGDGGPATQIESAKRLLDSGAITQAEYEQMKTKALAG